MGSVLVLAFLVLFALAIGQAVLRRALNPFRETVWSELPEALRAETTRVLPGFEPLATRITKRGDEVHAEGRHLGRPVTIEGGFDPQGQMLEFEVQGQRGARKRRGLARWEDLPAAARGEIQRVLGDAARTFAPKLVSRWSELDQDCFEVRGPAGSWRFEIAVSSGGGLLELEMERRQRGRRG